MNGLAPEEYARIIEQQKPHLIEIENHVSELEYGELSITLTVRAGVVAKMEFHDSKTWLRPKD
jgi:hypothetical protein